MSTADDALTRADRTSRTLRRVVIVAAVYMAVTVTVGAGIGVVNSFRAADYARQAFEQAKVNGDIGQLIRDCVEATPPDTEPTRCVRDGEARTGKAVAAIIDADGNGVLDAIEVRAALERIERAVRR